MGDSREYCSQNSSSLNTEKQYTYEETENIANYLKQNVSVKPTVGIICGSGLGSISEIIADPIIFNYKDIPNFPISTVIGHEGRLILGSIDKVFVMCMQGRFHYYEGNSLSTCIMPVRLMKLLGIQTLIVSNAAGGVNPTYKVGDIMIIKDHINFLGFAGINPLRGPNEDRLGPRFVAANDAYNISLIKLAEAVAEGLNLRRIQNGVYASVGGPNYETVAEMKILRLLGVDAVGMSTVHEVLAARHCNMDCFAFSLITNEGIAEYNTKEKPDGDHIVEMAKLRTNDLKEFFKKFVPLIDSISPTSH